MSNVRPSPIAGTWYPGKPDQLAKSIDAFLKEAVPPNVPGALVGVVAPHAGHRYSGAVAAHAFKAMQGIEIETIAVISPLHHYDSHPLLTTGHTAYWTPLGEIPVDHERLKEIQQACTIPITPIFNDPEHSLEIELPFLQRLFKSFKLIPIMIRDDSPAVCAALGEALAAGLRGHRCLLVASSDLSHFYPQPVAERLDGYMLAQIETLDPLAVLTAEKEEKGFACGHGAIAAVLAAARQLGATGVKIVKHATSGDVTGDYGSVVGYGAAVIWK
ncbi:MAG TPA: AmmeMemoRadiSam system protein B [Anaerolineales bacterium]|nr:AmmeMemoRadiSam system protein B [Anaerolineales bacterium]